jgi:phosphatidyl-N-methylethanolamine N-methyltransferase
MVSGVREEVFWMSAVVLSLERLAYAAIWRRPAGFRCLCAIWLPQTPPVDVLARLFVLFKILQCLVFVGWWMAHGDGLRLATSEPGRLILGGLMVIAGQILNLGVFVRLGRVGVFYGSRLGETVPWRAGFPFSWFRHPQYVGTVVSIWGAFIAMRHPAVDWSVIPALETLYYAVGACFEAEAEPGATA